MEKNDGGPAFPTDPQVRAWTKDGFNFEQPAQHKGMTLRDWFAGQSMAVVLMGLIGHTLRDKPMPDEKDLAREAYELADAMLAEREK